MATVVVPQHPLQPSAATASDISSTLNLSRKATPVPNKHIPVCPTGPSPVAAHAEPSDARDSHEEQVSSLLYPPDAYFQMSKYPPVYTIDVESLGKALDHWASQPLPDPSQVFPWLHGLHPKNRLQLGFFTSRRPSLRRAPKCWRGITIVKVGGDLTTARLKGAVSPSEVLASSGLEFLSLDPAQGFSVRNFQIQTAKLAALSDIVVYSDDGASQSEVVEIAARIATAQHDWKTKNQPDQESPSYNTFILTSQFGFNLHASPRILHIQQALFVT